MIASLYSQLPQGTATLLENAIYQGLSTGKGEAQIFFRADDIGICGQQFSAMIALFQKHNMPLCLAVVPTWIHQSSFAELTAVTGTKSLQWCWHQHGWLHRNYEQQGKKQEFGPARSAALLHADLKKGKERLEDYLGDSFSPFFTPPWNRCSQETLEGLGKLGYLAVSRSRNAKPPSPEGLPDIQVNIDLHTRKEPNPEADLQALLHEITSGVAGGTGGIMLHHQRMNATAFSFLDTLLQTMSKIPQLHPVLFHDLL